LSNLLSNAIKFTQQGEVSLHVSCKKVDSSTASLLFIVKDSGIGIPAAKLNRIFKAFEQVDSSTTRQFGGTGLGLAISSQIVSEMGGRLWVESEPGRGSQFFVAVEFSLPGAYAAEEQDDLADQQQVVVAASVENSRKTLGRELRQLGLTVHETSTGDEALALLQQMAAGSPLPLLVVDFDL